MACSKDLYQSFEDEPPDDKDVFLKDKSFFGNEPGPCKRKYGVADLDEDYFDIEDHLEFLLPSEEEFPFVLEEEGPRIFKEVHNIVIDELFSNTLHQEDLIESFKCPMENLSPGNCTINGFSLSIYTVHKKDLRCISSQICDFKFEGKSVTLDFGANSVETFSNENWERHCNEYLNQFYKIDGKFIEVITVPDTTGEIDSLWSLPINTLKSWCESSKSGLGLIVANYDIKEHLLFFGAAEHLLRKALYIDEFPDDIERLIVFNPSLKILFVIHTAIDNLKQKINHCVSDVKLLGLLLKEELKESGFVIAGLIAYSGKNKHHIEKCYHCNCFVVEPRIFKSSEVFDKFWQKYKMKIWMKEQEKKVLGRTKIDVFCLVSSKILGYMARYKTALLPKLEEDPTKSIEQAEMLLNRYQMEIAYSKESRIILRGPYGSGKTVIVLKRIQLLLETMKDKEVIYYVNFSGKSQVHYMVKQKIKVCEGMNKKLKVIAGGHSLSYIIKFVVLPEETRDGTEKVHLFVDEYISENLKKREAQALADLFTERKLFKDATILIALQPIEINRIHFLPEGGDKYSEEGQAFYKLDGIMKIYDLKYVMRTTVQINNLVQITQEFLDNQSNEYTREVQRSKQLSGTKPILRLQKRLSKLKRNISNITSNLTSQIFFNHSKNEQNVSSGTGASSSSNSTPNSEQYKSQELVDHDELHKLTFFRNNNNNNSRNKNIQKIVTKYHFSFSSIIGHGIPGPLPQIIRVQSSTSYEEQIALIGVWFKKIASIESKRMAVIHFESRTPHWLTCILESRIIFQSLNLTDDVEMFLNNHDQNLVLLKNYSSVKGLEFSHVLLVLDANEYHLKQFIPEAMARCQNNLSILINPSQVDDHDEGTVTELLKYWERINLEEENKIRNILQLQVCSKIRCSKRSDQIKEYCEQVCDNSTTYSVHVNCKLHQELLTEIHHSINLCRKSDDEQSLDDALSRMNVRFKDTTSKEKFSKYLLNLSLLNDNNRVNHSKIYDIQFGLKNSDEDRAWQLHDAAGDGDLQQMKILIKQISPAVLRQYRDGRRALHRAASRNQPEAIDLLVDHGWPVDEADRLGWTALHFAAYWNNRAAAQRLLLRGADPSFKDSWNKTPLDDARKNNCKEVARLLEKHMNLS